MALARPDFKQGKRVKDADVYRLFHGTERLCLCCGNPAVHAHHILHRSLGGDDIDANLAPLCPDCHRCHHSKSAYRNAMLGRRITKEMVDQALADYIRGPHGEAAARYLISKLGGMIEAEAFVLKLEGKA